MYGHNQSFAYHGMQSCVNNMHSIDLGSQSTSNAQHVGLEIQRQIQFAEQVSINKIPSDYQIRVRITSIKINFVNMAVTIASSWKIWNSGHTFGEHTRFSFNLWNHMLCGGRGLKSQNLWCMLLMLVCKSWYAYQHQCWGNSWHGVGGGGGFLG